MGAAMAVEVDDSAAELVLSDDDWADFVSTEVAAFCSTLPDPAMVKAVAELARTGRKKAAAAAAGVHRTTIDRWCADYPIEQQALKEAVARKLAGDRLLLAADAQCVDVQLRALRGEDVPAMQLQTAFKLREQNQRSVECLVALVQEKGPASATAASAAEPLDRDALNERLRRYRALGKGGK